MAKPIKVFYTVRNRLEMTKKSLESLLRNTKRPLHICVYNNNTTYRLDDHFEYFNGLYAEGKIAQITWTTKKSTFNAFSKAVACNMFGAQHLFDPEKDSYEFILMLDNDMLLMPKWDDVIAKAWRQVKQKGWNHIKLIGQRHNGIMHRREFGQKVAGFQCDIGTLGGSGFWPVQTNFWDDVGFLDIKQLVGLNKKHDQNYWPLMMKAAGQREYALSLDTKLFYHCGGLAGSLCNTLTWRPPGKEVDIIEFADEDAFIGSMDYETFWKYVEEEVDPKETHY